MTASGAIELHFDEPRGLAGLEEAVRFSRAFEGRAGGLTRTMLAPDRNETCTEALLRSTARAGRELGVGPRIAARAASSSRPCGACMAARRSSG